ncbi:MAG: hypothetical protein FWE03_01715 [Firmicutes bacterium]|nr:hypothetical protein [Bacillota bacterium]
MIIFSISLVFFVVSFFASYTEQVQTLPEYHESNFLARMGNALGFWAVDIISFIWS